MGEVIAGLEHGHLEAIPVGENSWRVSDASVPEDDPLHVVAFVEARDDDVDVIWLRGAISVPGRFPDLDSALDAIDDVSTTGQTRGDHLARHATDPDRVS
ncbi:hypothetical protein [Microbacterium terregens]|uniref:Uncharacterized protein n=1 Tax=Microbacterium terregens TaxID=69363 RepID=A0ABV5T1S7_9MICO